MTILTPSLLPPDALNGVRLAISASNSPADELARLGLSETHVRLALGEIARAVLVTGGTLAYGGHLEPDGYTQFLFGELKRFATPQGEPILEYLAWTEHRKLALSAIAAAREDLGLLGRILCLDPEGETVDETAGRGEAAPDPDPAPALKRRALTGMRQRMARDTAGRVVIGGKRYGFQGDIPGLMEEVLLCLDRPDSQSVYLAGGFGGAAAAIVAALEVADMAWFPALPNAPADDPRWTVGVRRLRAFRQSPAWAGLANGLTEDENRRLVVTHRPGEIAELVVLGLGRRRLS